MSVENLTIIGCSADGREAVRYLVPLLDRTRKAILLVPHIRNNDISSDLRRARVPVKSINPDSDSEGEVVNFERNRVYIVGGGWPAIYRYGIVSFFVNGKRIYAVDKNGDSLNPVMCGLVEIFRERTTGVILTGAGDDGMVGAQCINRNGGKVFVQTDSPESRREFEPWRYTEDMPKAVMGNAKVDFAGTLSELVGVINRD